MKKSLLLMAALLLTLSAQADNEILYGIYQGSGTLTAQGTKKVESYDIAIHLTAPMLVGLEIHGLRIPINTGATNATEYHAWLSKELNLVSGKNAPDIVDVTFTPDSKWVDVTFDKPYVITEEGVYAGYSFNITKVDLNNNNDDNLTPFMTIATADENGLFIHTSRTYRKWQTLSGIGSSAIVVRLGGDRIHQNAVTIVPPDELYAYTLVGKQLTLTYTLINHGIEAIKNIDYELEVGDELKESKHLSTSLKGGYYGSQKELKVTIPAIQTGGTRNIKLHITKVNGVDNEDEEPAANFSMAFLAQPPKHKPIMEEYTGTWCGWCPRGLAAMEALTEQLGDDFVGVAYHEGDPMQITTSFPNDVSGFPNSFIDRVSGQDPFGGTSGGSLGIKKDWEKRAAVIAPAALQLSADWADEAKTKITVNSKVSFIRDFANSPYRLAYILVADDLYGTGRSWAQVNNYAGSSTSDPYLLPLTKMAGTVVGMHFNDVAIQLSCTGAKALSESLPASVKEAVPYEHSYTFDITDNALVQDKTKLRAVVVLINTLTGEVANAEKATVGVTDAITAQQADADIVDIRYTDLLGRQVTQPQKGIYVKTVTYTDASKRSVKVLH